MRLREWKELDNYAKANCTDDQYKQIHELILLHEITTQQQVDDKKAEMGG